MYDADSGVMQALRDAVLKTVSPEMYGCNLCALTCGSPVMRRRWRGFVDGLPLPAVFLCIGMRSGMAMIVTGSCRCCFQQMR